MAEYTTNLNLEKPEGNENFRRAVINANMDVIDAEVAAVQTDLGTHLADYTTQIPFAVTGGSANTYTITLSPALTSYTAGVAVCIKIHVANTGASTININGLGAKTVLDSKGNVLSTGKLRLDGVYTLRYDGTNFILQGEGSSGNAVASDLLSGKTASTDAGDITGIMPNNGPASAETVNLTTEGAEYTIAAGYHSGLKKIKAVITNLAAAVIKAGVTVGGIAGTFTNDATAVAAQILSGITAYVNGNKITGTMPNNGAVTITPSPSNQVISAGYHNGSGTVSGVSVPAAHVLTGTTVAGTPGTMPNNGVLNYNPSTAVQSIPVGYTSGGTINAVGGNATTAQVLSGYTFSSGSGMGQTGAMANNGAIVITPSTSNQGIPAGYHNGGGYVAGDSDLVAVNIAYGVNIFGVAGSLGSIAGNGIIVSYDAQTYTQNSSPMKHHEIQVLLPGTYRVKFEAYKGGQAYGYAQIYVNGSARGTLREVTTSYVQYSEDLSLNKNDLVQTYVWSTAGMYVYTRSFQVCCGLAVLIS